MTAPNGSLYDQRAATVMACPLKERGWTGTFGELTHGLRSCELLTYECPRCATTVVTLLPPPICQDRVRHSSTRTAVKGYERMEYELTDHAVRLGMNAALPAVLELRGSFNQFGRGERDSPATTDLPITMRLAEPPEPFDWLRSA